jgi:uncharacterized membrane protein
MLQLKHRQRRIKLPGILQRHGSFLLFLLVMAFFGFLAQIQWIGYTVILFYGIFAFKKELAPQTTFILALSSLGVVPVAIVVGNWLIAQNFAAYSFVLFVLAVVELIFDLQRAPRTK